MSRKSFPIIFCVSSLLFIVACTGTKQITKAEPVPGSPQVIKEFRAAWVATVANINWPSKPGLPVEKQKQEAIALLDFLYAHHFNAVILQVRPQADALYASKIEPWSYYLTGIQGKAPDPFYDPLEFWVEEAHNRGLELHVWLNPYRAHHKDGKEISDQSIVKTHPELVVYLKEGYWWMDPARKEVQDITDAVVMDIVDRYDIDGVHMDDYFYPYPSYNGNVDFPDSISWAAYQHEGGKLSRADWRRDAVNQLIEKMYRHIKAKKPWVKLGISPFGIWRPGFPESIEGFDQYNQLYADARLWLNKGWLDYFSPQLYWPVNRYAQSFPVLLGWWAGENKMNRHLWPGINIGNDSTDKGLDEVINEIMIDRGIQPQSKGVVHWSISSLTRNPRMADTLLRSVYKKEALVPASPWLGNKLPPMPEVTTQVQGVNRKISWTDANQKSIFHWVVYYQYDNGWNYRVLNRNELSIELSQTLQVGKIVLPLKKIAVSAVDRLGNESEKKIIEIIK